MTMLPDRVDEVSQKYWETWRAWRYGQGWRLGPDDPKSLLSPFLVDNYDQLGDEGRTWFKQQAALVLWSASEVQRNPTGAPSAKLTPANVTETLDDVKRCFTNLRYEAASVKLEELIKLVTQNPADPDPKGEFYLQEALNIARHGPWNPKRARKSVDLARSQLLRNG